MRRLLLAVLCTLLCLSVVAAQEEGGYRLRVPDAGEYVNSMTDIAYQLMEADASEFAHRVTFDAMSVILFGRYDELVEVGFEDLQTLYETMKIGTGLYWNRNRWGQVLIHSWLNENTPDLSGVERLEFADFIITVIPRDFNNDGQDEYLFDMTKGEQVDRAWCHYDAEIVDYLIVQQTGDEYLFIRHPVPFGTRETGGGSNFGELKIIEIGFEDINGDGLPEWLVLTGGETFGGPGMGYLNTGQLYILAWRDGQLVDLARDISSESYPYSVTTYGEDAGVCHGPHPREVSWEFVDIDDDPALQILQHQIYRDNWYCETRRTRVLIWDASQDVYRLLASEESLVEETRNCVHRQAEEAMWSGNYTEAIALYEQAEALDSPSPLHLAGYDNPHQHTLSHYERILNELYGYMQLRLALAYILVDRPDEAEVILTDISETTSQTAVLHDFAQILWPHRASPLQACLASYDFFTANYPSLLLGTTLLQRFNEYPVYSPERIGCDAPNMIESVIAEHSFLADETPLDFMQSLNLPVYRHMTVDFNDDGSEEWLIWLESLMRPFFFVQTTDGYEVSRPAIDPYHQSEHIELWRLPDNAGISLIYFDTNFMNQDIAPWTCAYDPIPICGRGGGPGWRCGEGNNDPWPGDIIIWRMEDEALSRIFREKVCVTDLAQAFPDGESSTMLYGGELVYQDFFDEEAEIELKTLVFNWDRDRMAFVPPGVPETLITSTPYVYPQYFSVWQAYEAQDYMFIIESINDEMNGLRDDLDEYRLRDLFFRALALEALGRHDEALAQYVAIYEAAPESAWGLLAALHLEVVGE